MESLEGQDVSFRLVDEDSALAAAPRLLSFPSGYFADKEQVPVKVFQKKRSSGKVNQIVTCEIFGNEYRGSDFGSAGAGSDGYNYAIGIIQKGSNKIKLIPVQHPFSMAKVVADDPEREETFGVKSSIEQAKSRTEAFGSQKKKRAVKAAESNVISAENISGGSVMQRMISEQIEEQDDQQTSAVKRALEDQRRDLFPPYDDKTEELSEAYPISGIIPDDLQTSLGEHYGSLLEAAGDQTISSREQWLGHFFPHCSGTFVKSLVGDNISTYSVKHKNKTRTKTAQLLYLDMLINFYKLKGTGHVILKDDVASTGVFPPAVLQAISQSYSTFRKVSGKSAFSISDNMRYAGN
jgi:hypothetical protein